MHPPYLCFRRRREGCAGAGGGGPVVAAKRTGSRRGCSGFAKRTPRSRNELPVRETNSLWAGGEAAGWMAAERRRNELDEGWESEVSVIWRQSSGLGKCMHCFFTKRRALLAGSGSSLGRIVSMMSWVNGDRGRESCRGILGIVLTGRPDGRADGGVGARPKRGHPHECPGGRPDGRADGGVRDPRRTLGQTAEWETRAELLCRRGGGKPRRTLRFKVGKSSRLVPKKLRTGTSS